MGYQIGLDTGGTFTDAVLVDDARRVIAKAKALTRHERLLVGLGEALDAVLEGGTRLAANPAAAVTLVSLSTTLATNALVEGRGRAVGLVLIGLDPERLGRVRLAEALGGDPVVCVAGGHDANGAELAALDERALVDFVARHDAAVEAWAVSALFATRNPAHERRAETLIRAASARPASLGHTLSAGLDAPRRALTALLNARLVPLIGELLDAARELLERRAIEAPLMVVRGDGSLIGADVAARSPVETILSGPAASLVGARFLCGERALFVADTGGTTTDIARLEDGRPRLAADGATVGGWRTMVRAVDVRTVALGGDGELRIEPGDARDGRPRWRLGTRRVLPLSLLTARHPPLLDVLRAQLGAPRPSDHDARFALLSRPPGAAAAARLGRAEHAVLERLAAGPVAVTTLFAERSRERALERLERAGHVQLSAFTPSDASHLVGTQSGWERAGAELGVRLLARGWRAAGGARARGASDAASDGWASPEALARAACRHVAERVALALADAAAAEGDRRDGGERAGLTPSQRTLIESGFAALHPGPAEIVDDEGRAAGTGGDVGAGAGAESLPLLGVRLALALPIAGLGAPAASYHAPAARLLGTRVLLPEHGDVANALGAVVGHVRQEVRVTVVAAGGRRVRVLLESGPQLCDTFEEGIALAEREARAHVARRARAAGIGEMAINVGREDDEVERDGVRVFLESRVTAVASGRPASGAESPSGGRAVRPHASRDRE